MLQITYFSTAAVPQTAELVHQILLTARKNNQRDEITGLLVAGGNRYMQVIEGPSFAIESLYDNIRKDDRHLAVSTISSRKILSRSFDGWSMAFRREPALGEFDTFPDVLRYLTKQIDDTELRRRIQYFARMFILEPQFATPAPWKLAG